MVIVVAIALVVAALLVVAWLTLAAYTRRGTGPQTYRDYLPSEVQRRVAEQQAADVFRYVPEPYAVAKIDEAGNKPAS